MRGGRRFFRWGRGIYRKYMKNRHRGKNPLEWWSPSVTMVVTVAIPQKKVYPYCQDNSGILVKFMPYTPVMNDKGEKIDNTTLMVF